MHHVKKTVWFLACALFVGCSGAPKEPPVPSLNPEQAAELLHFDNKAEAWITHVKTQNPACTYKLELPDQSSHPIEIDLEHIVSCANRPSPRELDASVVFTYDKATQKWSVSRFAS
jgi:ssDNA-binding Zn-finger/Zn-ribbon topoisomerase 1